MNEQKETATISGSDGNIEVQAFINECGRAYIKTIKDESITLMIIHVLTNKNDVVQVSKERITAILQEKFICNSGSDGKKCPDCGREYLSGNFCTGCSKKMVQECDCWKLGRKFNCGFNECPTMGQLIMKFGYSLFPS